MSDTTADDQATATGRPSRRPILIGLALALAGAGSGFYAVQAGLLDLLGGDSRDAHAAAAADDAHQVETKALPDVVFIEVPQVVISLGPDAQAQHLRFRASLEVPSRYRSEVQGILPRIQDVLNSYLRALESEDIEAQGALVRLRGQMLRRIKLVAGEGRVRDLLVLEFVLT